MLHFRFFPFSRATALGVAISVFGLSLAPLAHAGDEPPAEAPAGVEAPPPPKPPSEKDKRAARKAYGQGEKAFAAQKYDEAFAGFEKAENLIPSPHAEYWMAKCQDLLGKVQLAIEGYEMFLKNSGAAGAGQDKVDDATSRLEELKLTLVGQLELTTEPAAATVAVDGEPQEGSPPMTLKLEPGSHVITVTATGYDTTEITVEAKAGEKVAQQVTLKETPLPAPAPPPPPPPPPPAPPPPPQRSMVPAYVTLGIAGAGAVVGTIFGLKALSAKSDYEDNPTRDKADETERNALISDMAFGVAITLGVTGIVLLTSPDETEAGASASRHTPPKMDVSVTPYAGPKGGGAAARLRF